MYRYTLKITNVNFRRINLYAKSMAADEILELEVWPGEWDLPSVDPDCISIMVPGYIDSMPVMFCT